MEILGILIPILASVIACLIVNRGVKSILLALVAGFIVGLINIFWGHATIGFFYPGAWALLVIGGILGAVIGGLLSDSAGNSASLMGGFIPGGGLVVLLIVSGFSSCEMLHSSRYYNLLGDVEQKNFAKDMPIIDTKFIRLVPKKVALNKAQKVLGQAMNGTVLGSQLQIDSNSAAIQVVQSEKWWIFPLDFIGFNKWRTREFVPGYIRVHAQDPNQEAQFMDTNPTTGEKFELRYTRSAYFGYWLDRNVYYAYPNVAREEYTMEVDDNWRPYYVISATFPSIGFSGYQTKGVIIYDPQNGKHEFKPVGEEYDWVDRVKPLSQALSQVKMRGLYVHGWHNTVGILLGGKKDISKPTDYIHGDGADMWFVRYGKENYWFTGMTSVNADQSIIGGILVNTKTGKTIQFPMSGTDENGVIETVDSSLGADSERWDPVQPIPYNINGIPTWVVSIISEEGIFQRVALVKMDSDTIRVIEKNLTKALRNYRTMLAQQGNKIAPTSGAEFSSVGPVPVFRAFSKVMGGDESFYLMLKTVPGKFFSSTGETNETLLIAAAKRGDLVTVHFIDTGEMVYQVDKITIDGVVAIESDVQLEFKIQREESEKVIDDVEDTRDAEEAFKRMTPEEKRKLMKK